MKFVDLADIILLTEWLITNAFFNATNEEV